MTESRADSQQPWQSQEPEQFIVGISPLAAHDPVHEPEPQFTCVPVHESEVPHWTSQEPSPQFRFRSPQASVPPSQTREQA